MSVVDDFGRYSANPTLLRANCYPLKLDSVKEDSIKKHLTECADAGLIVLYTVADKAFLEMQDFRQQMRAKESKYPARDAHMRSKCVADDFHPLSNAHLGGDGDGDVLAAQQPQEKKARRLSSDWQLPSKWGKWTLENLQWDELSVRRESEKFKDYWVAKGGREACKLDWEATWRNWCRNAKVQTGQASASLLAGGI